VYVHTHLRRFEMSDGASRRVERLTIRSTPPDVCRRQRRSYWPGVFGEGRECAGEWVRTAKWFARATASQVASDIRSAHMRDLATMRVRGVLRGDRWETRWGNDPSDPDPDHFYIWLCFVAADTSPHGGVEGDGW
jgi:hypothetical protein